MPANSETLNQSSLPIWSPLLPPIYDIEKTYLENIQDGPCFSLEIPDRTFKKEIEWFDFLGYNVASKLGVPAGPLLDAKWIALAAKMGFDILTYKTIRSHAYPAHPLPNMIYVNTDGPINKNITRSAKQIVSPSFFIEDLAVTNSFGMPSMTPEYLMSDIAKAKSCLSKGQVLVVSITGTQLEGKDFFDDFVCAAKLAVDAGASIIEANFSCPNVSSKQGALYMDPSTVYSLGKKLMLAIGHVPLIIKVGLFSDLTNMQSVFLAAAQAGVRAISGINTVSMQVINDNGNPALGKNRLTSGICGGPIRLSALNFITAAKKIIQQEKLDLTLIGVGGITKPEHFQDFFNHGADFAQSATGMMWDPYLALRYHQLLY